MRRYTLPLLLYCCGQHQQPSQASPYDYGDRQNANHLAEFADDHDITRGDDIVLYELPWWHPEIEWAVINEIGAPTFHPLLDNDAKFQRFIEANTDENHQFLDPDTYDYLQSPDASWMPRGHPILDDYFVYEDLPKDEDLPVVPFAHPDIHEVYLSGEQQPKGHPSVSALVQHLIPDGHPDVDDLLLDRKEIPSWHPNLNLVVSRSAEPIESTDDASSEQPESNEEQEALDPVEDHQSQASDVESLFDSDETIEDSIPDESTLGSDQLDGSEPQDLFDAESTLSSDEGDETAPQDTSDAASTLSSDEVDESQPEASVVLSSRLDADELIAFAQRYDITQGDDIAPYELPFWHPEIEWAVMSETGGPSFHPLLDNDPEFQRFIQANTDENHQFLDPDTYGFIQNPDRTWMPRGHPIIDDYFVYKDFPEDDRLPSVPFNHPDPHDAYLNGEHLPKGHPSISLQLQGLLPEGHPDVNDLFLDELRELPSWHPDIGTLVNPRSLATSPGSLLCYAVSALLAIVALARVITKQRNAKRTREVIVNKDMQDGTIITNVDYDTDASSSRGSWISKLLSSDSASPTNAIQTGVEIVGSKAVPVVDSAQASAHTMIRRDQLEDSPSTNEERILVYKEKQSNWKTVFGRRVIKSSHSIGEATGCLLYLLVNAAALLASPSYGVGVGFGSLSVGNTLFLFLTAARNSILTWVVGISFEQAIVYHRFIGRLTVLLAFIHASFHIDYITEKTSDRRTITGLVSLGCGLVIVLSSLNVVRRKYFNVFFWSHFAFVGFIVGVYLHATPARPFIIASVACYGLDKGLQLMRKWPKQTTAFAKVDGHVVHCQFPKSTLSSLLGKHEVGQYVFVNFPSLSLQEWHPFSVASGPSDPHIDIYIKALGDHTKKIVEYAEHCAAENKQVKIRSDGPYGSLPFNYRRYGSILLVVGGIGITPVLSILKDLYQNQTDATKKKRPSHCIRDVTFVWVVPYASEALFLLDQLNSFRQMSLEDPLLPDLKSYIHVTRASDGRAMIEGQKFVYSRPQFNDVMDECMMDKPDETTSTLVYACGPTKMVNQLWDASMKKSAKNARVDFYHETFEF